MRPEDQLPHEQRCQAIHEPTGARCFLALAHDGDLDEPVHVASPSMSTVEGEPITWTDAGLAAWRSARAVEIAARYTKAPRPVAVAAAAQVVCGEVREMPRGAVAQIVGPELARALGNPHGAVRVTRIHARERAGGIEVSVFVRLVENRPEDQPYGGIGWHVSYDTVLAWPLISASTLEVRHG